MKKSLLLLASLLMSIGSFAQRTAPVPSSTQELETDDTPQFLYNKEAGGFFAGANDWNTRASIAVYADSVKFVSLDGDGYNFCCFPSVAKDKWLYVSCNNYDAMWVDADSPTSSDAYPGTDAWQIEKSGNAYKIYNTNYDQTKTYTLGIAEFFKGVKGDTRTYIYDKGATYDVNEEAVPAFDGKFYDEWVFISADEYEALKPQVEVYLAAKKLDAKLYNAKLTDATHDYSALEAVYNNLSSTIEELDAAIATVDALVAFKAAYDKDVEAYPSLDFSAPKAVYDKASSTAEELADAQNQLQAIIGAYLSTQASFESPISFAEQIGDGSKVDPWTQKFTGDGTVGSHTTNTWSTEANNGADGTDMTTPFIEHWTASGGILSDQKIFQTLPAAAPGLYKLTINLRAYSEAGGIEKFEGLKMYFGDNEINPQDKVEMYMHDGKCVLWSPDKFSIIAILKEAQDVEFGFEIKDANFNWLAFKDVSLYYYGNENCEENANKLLLSQYEYEKVDEDTDANPEIIKAYNDAVDALKAASVDELEAAAAVAATAKAALDKNIAAYEDLMKAIDKWENFVADKQDLAGEEWDRFSDFIQSEDEIDGYPTPNPPAFKEGDRSLTTDEINEYISKVDALYADAVAHSLSEGSDCTDMIINPGFTDANGKGWTQAFKSGNLRWTGGIIPGFPVAESWHATFDIYQEVYAPDGIYSLTLNGFCRLEGGDTEIPAEIYLNDFSTKFQNITADPMPKDQAQDGFNCYLTNGNESEAIKKNPIFEGNTRDSNNDATDTEDSEGYYPNGMEGASVAFSAGRYEAKVYGLVEGGKMKIGARCTSPNSWVLWSNFKLTYEGKSEEALTAILPSYVEQLSEYLETNVDNLTEPAVENANAAIAQAEGADDGDSMYEALAAVNKALNGLKANNAEVQNYYAASEAIDNAANANPDADMSAYNAISDEIANYTSLTTDELKALIAKMKEVAALMSIPANYTEATDDVPVDFTQVIVNPDLETGDASGWTYEFATITNIGFQNNSTYSGDEVSISNFIEGWRSGNAAIGDGAIEQTLVALPAGTYVLGVDAIANLQSSNDTNWAEVTKGVYLFAESDQLYAKEIKTANGKPQHFELVFDVANDKTNVRIGVMASGATANWLATDNWTLSYCGKASTKDAETAPEEVAIESVQIVATPVAIYSAAGARINSYQKGVNIVKMANGKVVKVLK